MSINKRLVELREELNISQEKFGERLMLVRSSISNYESEKRAVPDRTISDICREFNVNETWLRTGEGEMFKEPTVYEELMKDYQMDDIGKLLFQTYIEMTLDEKKVLSHKIRQLAKIIVENDL